MGAPGAHQVLGDFTDCGQGVGDCPELDDVAVPVRLHHRSKPPAEVHLDAQHSAWFATEADRCAVRPLADSKKMDCLISDPFR